ncbi:redoxin family protein [bacterium]|nr:redoxin family protein [bacterium]
MIQQALALLILLVGCITVANGAEPSLGHRVDDLRFKDIRYIPRSLRDLGEHRAYVFVFTNTSCPIVKRSWPKLKRLDAAYREQDVQFVAVNVGPEDEIAEIAQQGIDFGIEFLFVKDIDGYCTAALGVTRTPEVAVLDREYKLRYRGRIDDQLRLSGERPGATRDDLQMALEDMLHDRPVAVAETPVDGCLITSPTKVAADKPITFHEHIEPLMQQRCQECHRPGGGSPFELLSYDDVASQSAMIAEVVRDRRMPPWYANRKQHFSNERGLSYSEREQVLAWIAAGKPQGDPTKSPPPRTFPIGKWEIGEPDLIIKALETHQLPADGFIDYKYVVLPYVFLQETWISAAEILPSNPDTVHHCNLGYFAVGKEFDDSNFITGRVPGGTAMVLDEGLAFRIPANSIIGLQIHYTTTGKPEKNRMSVGFRFPRSPVRKELHHLQVTTSRFAIPPGASAHPVTASRTLPCDTTGLGMFSHMHLRGKDMTFVAHRPDAEPETLLTIPNYHYDWQQNYRFNEGEKKFPAGTRIEVLAHYDNSAFNPFNPDPTVTVKHGPQTTHEMMFGFFFYTDDAEELNLPIDPKTGQVRRDAE